MPAHVEVDPDLLAEAIARLRTEYATVEETWRACSASMSETSGGWVGNSCEASSGTTNNLQNTTGIL